ncbi:MAG: hypothetical protein JWM36_1176 [Hyphomicrobiales bacterium]|nr:hypothetical protein [Hyphomicrobiales bacterium]
MKAGAVTIDGAKATSAEAVRKVLRENSFSTRLAGCGRGAVLRSRALRRDRPERLHAALVMQIQNGKLLVLSPEIGSMAS